MKKRLLITLPRSDDVTEYLYVFSNPIIKTCYEKSIPIKKLEDTKVTKKNFENLLRKINFKMIVFNGHGSPDCITGYKEEPIIQVNDNEQLLRERITYARSCWVVLGVGKQSMRNNKKGCFIGYKIPFMFLMDSTRATNPIKDKIAKVFFNTSNFVPLGILKGLTGKEANENSKKAMLKEINKALRKKDKDSKAIAETLWNNYLGQELVGNPGAKL
ncbi:hypothetical protein K9L16_01520 [Candidatus Pacearchaeota archaeon]|nr:hypothetical protein [Candidatus Pacearchaeota archaeon]